MLFGVGVHIPDLVHRGGPRRTVAGCGIFALTRKSVPVKACKVTQEVYVLKIKLPPFPRVNFGFISQIGPLRMGDVGVGPTPRANKLEVMYSS